MSEQGIKIVISAKAAVKQAIAKVTAQLKAFASGAVRIVKTVALGFAGAAASVLAFGAKCVQAYGVQEKAEKALLAAHRAFGEEAEKLLEREKRLAAAIQDETAVGDENVLGMMARLRMLGVLSQNLDAAAKASIALTHAGMGEEQAMKAVAQAYLGHYDALQRYIPALKDAATAEEKAKIVNDFLTKQYGATKDELDTVAGAWKALQGRMGDALEVVGRAITGGTNLQDVFKRLGDKVQEVAGRFAEWLDNGGMLKLQEQCEIFAVRAAAAFDNFKAKLDDVYTGVMKVVGGIEKAVKWIKSASEAPESWEDMLVNSPYNVAKGQGDDGKVMAAKTVEEKIAEIRARYAEKAKAVAVEKAKETEREIEDISIAGAGAAGATWSDFWGRMREMGAKAMQEIGKYMEQHQKEVNKLLERQKELERELREEEEKRSEEKRLAALRAEIDALQKQIDLKNQLANQVLPEKGGVEKPKGFKGGGVGKDGVAGNWDDDKALEQARKLRDKEARGVRLSKRDREWLSVWEAQRKAAAEAKRAAALKAQKDKELADAERKAAEARAEKIRKELAETRGMLKRLLTAQ